MILIIWLIYSEYNKQKFTYKEEKDINSNLYRVVVFMHFIRKKLLIDRVSLQLTLFILVKNTIINFKKVLTY